MEIIRIKHRDFTLIENVSENSFIMEYKNKKYFVRKFVPKSEEGEELTFAMERLSVSGVRIPKLRWIDKKAGYVVSDYIEGVTVMEYLSKNEMTEDLYDQLFKNAYRAKIRGMTLNYEIDKWMISNGELVYVHPIFIIYKKEKDLVDRYLRLWFDTKELAEFMDKNGVFYDKTRIKTEYLTNKHIVLMTCKYYR